MKKSGLRPEADFSYSAFGFFIQCFSFFHIVLLGFSYSAGGFGAEGAGNFLDSLTYLPTGNDDIFTFLK